MQNNSFINRLGFLLLFILHSSISFGVNVHSAVISYEALSTDSFRTTYQIIVDHKDSIFSTSSVTATVSCPDSAMESTLTLTLTSRVPIEGCPGNQPWLFTFHSNFDLSNSTFGNLSNCCYLRFDLKIDGLDNQPRTTADKHYSSAYVYTDRFACSGLKNTVSARFTMNRGGRTCCNQPFYSNVGAQDIIEFDSFSYNLIEPNFEEGKAISYNAGFDKNNPFSNYNPAKGKPNPKVSPPIGVFLDEELGDFISTPTDCDQQAIYAVEVTEWRRLSVGSYVKVGTSVLYNTLQTAKCESNNPPIVEGPYAYKVCEGEQLCFNINTDDKVKVPPPPTPAPKPDSVKITWNHGITDATFTVLNPNALHQTGRFCWTPKTGESSALPYTFTVTARDNHCELNAITTRSFSVKVNNLAEGTRTFQRIAPNMLKVDIAPDMAKTPNPQVVWQLRDSAGDLVLLPSRAKFTSSGSFNSTSLTDTIEHSVAGRYIIQSTITDVDFDCPVNYYDTVELFSVGIPGIAFSELQIIPNPASRTITVSAGNMIQSQNPVVVLTDINGRELIHRPYKVEESIDISFLPAGLYEVRLIGESIYRGRLLVTK